MSDFKVGDKVKCIRVDSYGKLTEGKIYTITSVVTGITITGGSSVCVDGIRDDWWYADRFELLHQPVEVHTGGPYVARSEYERVCVERDNLQEIVKVHEGILLDSIERHGKSVFVGNPNGWPLVPVDPSCIPDGHRAVEVTCATAGKLVASSDGNARHFNGTHIVPRLVVEPIPTPAPDVLPRPEFPAWIRAGWWVAMDAGGFWYMSENEPIATEPVLGSTADRGTWNPPNMDDIRLTHGVTASMKAVPCDRWREAKWQIN